MTPDEKKAARDVADNVRRVMAREIVATNCGLITVAQSDGGVWLSRAAAEALLRRIK